MPTEMTEHGSEVDAPATAKAGAAVDGDGKTRPTDPASKSLPPPNQRFTLRRKLLIGVLGAVVIAAALYGIPWIRFVLSTVSTDDAFVNGHVTFVAARVHGQVSRVLVDDNNRVHRGDLLVQLEGAISGRSRREKGGCRYRPGGSAGGQGHGARHRSTGHGPALKLATRHRGRRISNIAATFPGCRPRKEQGLGEARRA